MVDITGLGKLDNGVNQNILNALSEIGLSQENMNCVLLVFVGQHARSIHGEHDASGYTSDFPPGKFLKMSSQFRGVGG